MQFQPPPRGVLLHGGLEELTDLSLQRCPADQPHGVEVTPIVAAPQSVDRHHAGVFQPASDFRLHKEAFVKVSMLDPALEDLLQRDVAVELLVTGDEDLAQSAAGKFLLNLKPLMVAGQFRHRARWRCGRRRVRNGVVNLRFVNAVQRLPQRTEDVVPQRGLQRITNFALRLAAQLRFHGRKLRGGQRSLLDQRLQQRLPPPARRPSGRRLHQLVRLHKVFGNGQHHQQLVARGELAHRAAPIFRT